MFADTIIALNRGATVDDHRAGLDEAVNLIEEETGVEVFLGAIDHP
jgi:hypothetical protein